MAVSQKDIDAKRKESEQEARDLMMKSIEADQKKTKIQTLNHIHQSKMEAIADSGKKQAAGAAAFSFN